MNTMTTNDDNAAAMPTADLGRGGPIVSRFALGTMTFGVETDESVAHGQLATFVDSGGTFIDTADVYGGGESERIIGRWATARGGFDGVVVSTKGRFAPPAGSHGASRRGLVRSVEGSLGRLGADGIDLYFVHGWDAHTPVAETLDTLTSLVRAGKIHHLGWSNVTGWQLQEILTTAALGDFVSPVAVQPQYNLHVADSRCRRRHRTALRATRQPCRARLAAIQTWGGVDHPRRANCRTTPRQPRCCGRRRGRRRPCPSHGGLAHRIAAVSLRYGRRFLRCRCVGSARDCGYVMTVRADRRCERHP